MSTRSDWPVWARIGLLSFGGPAGQIALMHRELVDQRGWVDEARFLQALNVCMLLPGPEAMQLATWIGWLRGGWRGGLVAGLWFVMPGALAILGLSLVYVLAGQVGWIEGAFFGLKAAVIALVAQALVRVARKALKGWRERGIALAAFVALFGFGVPFPLVVLAAGAFGGWVSRGAVAGGSAPSVPVGGVVTIWLALWLVPVAALLWLPGVPGVLGQAAVYFSQMAVLTFGGAYAVLTWVAQAAVQDFGWLTAPQMLDGLAMAETTPGPLILTLQFVGFMAGFQASGGSLTVAVLASLVTLWVTFVPCFLWVFALAPQAERVRGNPRLAGALAAVTAAVVGVIANLGLWFAVHALFAQVQRLGAMEVPVWSSLNPVLALLTLTALALAFGTRLPVWGLILAGALAGVAVQAV